MENESEPTIFTNITNEDSKFENLHTEGYGSFLIIDSKENPLYTSSYFKDLTDLNKSNISSRSAENNSLHISDADLDLTKGTDVIFY
jgi:hypothetical protein